MPRATRSSLTVTNSCGSSASRPSAITPLGSEPRTSFANPLSASMDSRSRTRAHERDAGREVLRLRGDIRGRGATARRRAGLEAPLRVAQLLLERGDPLLDRLRATSAHRGDGALDEGEALLHQAIRRGPGDGLDAAHAGPDAALAGDDEAPDLAGRTAVRAAAQLVAEPGDPDRPDPLAVLLVEEGVRARLLGLGHGHPLDADLAVLAHDAAHLALDGQLLVVGEAAVEREVEAQVVGRHERARLARPLPHHVAQRAMEQVRAGVVAHRVRPSFRVHLGAQDVADPDLPVEDAPVDREARGLGPRDALDVVDVEQRRPVGRPQDAGVRDLAAALRVERGPVQHDLRAGAGLRPAAPPRARPRGVSYSVPSRRMATTRPSAAVLS